MRLKTVTICIALSLFGFYALLLLSLLAIVGSADLGAILTSPRTVSSIRLSVMAATLATLCSMVLAVPAGYALSRYEFWGKRFIDLLLELPLVVTPVALGAMLLLFFNTALGQMLAAQGVTFVFGFPGIVLAQFVTTAGLATRMVKSTFDEISPRFETVACTLGATPVQAFFTVTLPMAQRGILAAMIITFAKCIGEFGATIMLAGAMPMKTETLPISIFMRLGNADIQGMAVMILLLLTLGLSVILVLKALLRVNYD
jgi:molybdate transport system permease protein